MSKDRDRDQIAIDVPENRQAGNRIQELLNRAEMLSELRTAHGNVTQMDPPPDNRKAKYDSIMRVRREAVLEAVNTLELEIKGAEEAEPY